MVTLISLYCEEEKKGKKRGQREQIERKGGDLLKINTVVVGSVVLCVCDIPPGLDALILHDPQTSMEVKGQLGVDI